MVCIIGSVTEQCIFNILHVLSWYSTLYGSNSGL